MSREALEGGAIALACQKLNHDLQGKWGSADRRATAVLEWCVVHGYRLDPRVTAMRLEAAMSQMPFWNQGPSNYFDMARALSAAYKTGGPT